MPSTTYSSVAEELDKAKALLSKFVLALGAKDYESNEDLHIQLLDLCLETMEFLNIPGLTAPTDGAAERPLED
jgi:hypothetical protein